MIASFKLNFLVLGVFVGEPGRLILSVELVIVFTILLNPFCTLPIRLLTSESLADNHAPTPDCTLPKYSLSCLNSSSVVSLFSSDLNKLDNQLNALNVFQILLSCILTLDGSLLNILAT